MRESWWGPGKPATGVLLDRMILMPMSWVVILFFNTWTIIHLRGETGHIMTLTSIKRLQLRLVLLTAAFIVIWVLISIPLYADKRTFALEICVKVSYPALWRLKNKTPTIIEMTKRHFTTYSCHHLSTTVGVFHRFCGRHDLW